MNCASGWDLFWISTVTVVATAWVITVLTLIVIHKRTARRRAEQGLPPLPEDIAPPVHMSEQNQLHTILTLMMVLTVMYLWYVLW